MAIYHLSVKTVSRSSGRSATGAAAYRAGVEIVDERTGLVHDYTRRSGVVSADLTLPANAPAWASDRSALWNGAELSETRKNSTVAREFELALPDELTAAQRRELVATFARELADRHGVAVDAAIHLPDREGDKRNHHAHVLTTTRRLGPEGFGEKARELDDRKTGPDLVSHWRGRWAELTNQALERAGESERVDHRSLVAQRSAAIEAGDKVRAESLDYSPQIHLGPVPSADLRQARRTQQEPATDRARQMLQIQRENSERASLRQTLAHAWKVVREQAAAGMEAFRKNFRQANAGMAAFRERFEAYQAEQARQQQETRERQQAQQEAQERERNAGVSGQHPDPQEPQRSRSRSMGGMRRTISRPAPELDGPELEMD